MLLKISEQWLLYLLFTAANGFFLSVTFTDESWLAVCSVLIFLPTKMRCGKSLLIKKVNSGTIMKKKLINRTTSQEHVT